MTLSLMDADINEIIVAIRNKFQVAFQSSNQDNSMVSKEASAHEAMYDYLIASRIGSYWGKNHVNAKKRLDNCMVTLGINDNGQAGRTLNLHESNIFEFTKRQNKDGEQLASTDLLNALARLGVEKSIVDQAVKLATKSRKGNTYYEVNVIEA